MVGQLPLQAPSRRTGRRERAGARRWSRARRTLARRGILPAAHSCPRCSPGAGQQRHVMSTIVVVAAVQLVLLAIWVLGQPARAQQRRAPGRDPGGAAARLSARHAARGHRRRARPSCACSGPCSELPAPGHRGGARPQPAAGSGRRHLRPTLWTFAALGVTRAGDRRRARRGHAPAAALLRADGDRGGGAGRRAPVERCSPTPCSLVLSVVALVALATSGALAGRSNPIASAAPGLIALGAAVLAVQLVLFVCRLGISASAVLRPVAAFLALRQIARRPGVLRQARVLIIALCLACFATSAWSVARCEPRRRGDVQRGDDLGGDGHPAGHGRPRAGGRPGRPARPIRHGGGHR